MKPGDLVILSGRDLYVGLDIASKRYFTVHGGSVGVFLGLSEDSDEFHEIADEYILTHGRVLACGKGDWSVANE